MSSGLNRSTSPEVALAETNDAIVGVKSGARNRHDSSGRENTIRGSAITKSGPQVTIFQKLKFGGVGKRLTPAVLKTVRPERVSWVRIPPPPPASRFLPSVLPAPCSSPGTLATIHGRTWAGRCSLAAM